MKKSISILMLIIICLVIQCEEETEKFVNQIAIVFGENSCEFYNGEYYCENELWGNLYSDPLTRVEYIKVGSEKYENDDYFGYYGFEIEWEEIPLPLNLDPLNVEIKTQLGLLKGSVSLPDTINTIHSNVDDTLNIGQSLTISWTGSNFDFVSIIGWFYNEEWIDLDTLISSNSVTFDGSIFNHNGDIHLYFIPVNGPIPVEGASSNMTGDGGGFLYYINDINECSIDLVVGGGLAKPVEKLSKVNKYNRTRVNIIKFLGY